MSTDAENRGVAESGQVGVKPGDGAPNGFMWQRARTTAGLSRIGIEGDWEIVVADRPAMVETTAAETLRQWLARTGRDARIVPDSRSSGRKRFLLGLDSNHSMIRALGDKGALKIRGVSAEDDGFHLKRVGADIAIAGANPRGVLYGVYAFQDFIHAGAEGVLDVRRVPRFSKRGSGPLYCGDFSRRVNLQTEDFPEEKAAYLSRLGINQLTSQGVGNHLHQLVGSDVFPFLPAPRADYQRKIRAMSGLCRKYGIDHYQWIGEPALVREAGILERYPKEALGRVRRPWGGDPDGMDDTLCVNSPIVQEYLRDMMRKLVREYPDAKGVLLYNLDGDAWLCTPGLCERCGAVCGDASRDQFTPWETQAGLVTLLAEAAHEENAGFEVMFWGAVHYHGDAFARMVRAARGYDRLAGCWNGSDRSVMVPAAAEPDPAFLLSRDICAERGIPFHGLCELNNLESVPQSLPFPFHVCGTLKRHHGWGVRNLTEIYGLAAEHNAINALVAKAFQWDADLNPEEFLSDLARRQFGSAAGPLMYRAWEEMRRAFDAWDGAQFGPLDGSQHILSIGLAVALPPPILADITARYNGMLRILTNVEPWRAEAYGQFKEQAFLDRMTLMHVHLARASELARKAIEAARDGEYIEVCHYEGPNGRPTCKEYAELNHAPIAIAEAICGLRCIMLRACRLLTEIERAHGAGDTETARAKEKLHRELVREDIHARERFRALLLGFAGMRPQYTRTGLTEGDLSDALAQTDAAIGAMQAFLGHEGDDA